LQTIIQVTREIFPSKWWTASRKTIRRIYRQIFSLWLWKRKRLLSKEHL